MDIEVPATANVTDDNNLIDTLPYVDTCEDGDNFIENMELSG